jgi:hypothetical protein
MKILLGDCYPQIGREDIFKPTTGNGSLYEISNNNGEWCLLGCYAVWLF